MNTQEFEQRLNDAFDKWNDNGCLIEIMELIGEQKMLSPRKAVAEGMTTDQAFDKYWDDLEERFEARLNEAVGGDWREVGKQLGYSDEKLEHIYVDYFQAKTDAFFDYEQMMLDLGAKE
jgi:hypothetical protein